MALKFDSQAIDGTHGPLVISAPELKVRRFGVFGLKGEAEIFGQQSGREIEVDIVLHKQYGTVQNLLAAVKKLRDKLGKNGTLEETGTVPQKLEKCTFIDMEPVPFEGQADAGPIKDTAGMMESPPKTDKWIARYRLKFRQLVVK